MSYNLFIDDIRNPDWPECIASGIDPKDVWVIVRSSKEAKIIVSERGMPLKIAFDHDLGIDYNNRIDTTMIFLKWFEAQWDGISSIPEYTIHSSNPSGCENIRSFMESWKKSINL